MRVYSLAFGALVLEALRAQGYQVVSYDPRLKGTDAGIAAALSSACEAGEEAQRARRDGLPADAQRLRRDIDDENDPEVAERYAKVARELRDLETEMGVR